MAEELRYTEEDLSQAFYKGREQKSLPDGKTMFIRPTFNGYLRELEGKEDANENWERRVQEFKGEDRTCKTCKHETPRHSIICSSCVWFRNFSPKL